MTLRSDILDPKDCLLGTAALRLSLRTAACHLPVSSLSSWTGDIQPRTLVGYLHCCLLPLPAHARFLRLDFQLNGLLSRNA
jgi:hypothetical protein